MPVYSEVIKNEKIQNLIKDKYQNILILGCGACMNESLSYTHNSPIYVKDENGNDFPFSIMQELKRITDMLSDNGYKAKYKLIPEGSNTLCMRKIGEWKNLLTEELPDVIFALCCPSGFFGLKSNIKDISIIPISKSTGFLSYGYKDENGKRILIKEQSKVIKFQP